MKLLILCTQWGLQNITLEDFFSRLTNAGYDGVDTWIPEDPHERKKFVGLLNEYKLPIVCHQFHAKGTRIKEFCRSFEYYLNLSMECNPLLINSHSGKDYFTTEEQLKVIDVAQEFSVKNNIRIAHETHRGRIGFSPYNARDLFALRPDMKITADFSHWVCVTESYLENSPEILEEAIIRTEHLHARVGHPEAPQVTDPRAKEWHEATGIFFKWWDKVIEQKKNKGEQVFTITPEFGPPPYMVTSPSTGLPIADQFEINNYMKNELRKRYLE
ncbi:MAG: sugar phosphate isomerase/epimerase [Ginsengibacter sp.]